MQREKEAVEVTAFNNIKEALDKARTTHRTNDSRSYQNTLIAAMAPAKAGKYCHKLGRKLGYKESTFRRKIRAGIQARKEMLQEGRLMQMHRRKCNTRYTPECIAALQHHILNDCADLVAVSPKSNDNVLVEDPITHTKSRQQKRLRTVPVRELLKSLTRPANQGGFPGARDEETGWELSDTALRMCMPGNCVQMTGSHMQLCSCETCIDCKGVVQSANGWCTRQCKKLRAKAESVEQKKRGRWRRKKTKLLKEAPRT